MNIRMIISLFVLWLFFTAAMLMGGSIAVFIDLPSMLIVFAVIFAGTLWAFPFTEILSVFRETILGSTLDVGRGDVGYALFTRMKESAVAGGLAGTLLGLVMMLRNLDDPTTIGPAMAVALLTMLYGVVFGEIICGAAAADCLVRAGLASESRGRRGSVSLYFIVLGLTFALVAFLVMLLAMLG